MNLLLKRVLSYGMPAVAGAGAGAAGWSVYSGGAHESLTLAIGDTITPRFSIATDSVLKAPGGGIVVVRACGTSKIFLRNYQRQTQRTADTVDVTVPCAVKDTAVATVGVCIANGDSAAKYGILGGDVSPTAEQLSHIHCDSTANLTLAAFRQREFEARHPRIASTMLQPPNVPVVVDPDPWGASRSTARR